MDIIGFYPTFYMPWIGSAWLRSLGEPLPRARARQAALAPDNTG